jgi:site-specific recombinase
VLAFSMLESLAGIAVIFVLNLTISFAIALLLAMRAYDLPERDHFSPVESLPKAWHGTSLARH